MKNIKEKVSVWIRELELTRKEKWLMRIIIIVTMILTVGMQIWDNRPLSGILQRNTYGEGSRQEVLQVDSEEIADLTESDGVEIEITIEEQKYTSEELPQAWAECMEQIDQVLLGENTSEDEIYYDLNLVDSVSGSGIAIEWSWEPYEVLNTEGVLQQTYIEEEGTLLQLTAILYYEEEKMYYTQTLCLYPKPKSDLELFVASLQEEVKEIQEESADEEQFTLPDSVEGISLTWYQQYSYRGIYLLLVVLAGVFYYCYYKLLGKKRAFIERKEQMQRDYPVVIQTLALYLGAGMTITNAWKRMALQENSNHYIYEEMRHAYYEMENGVSEIACYETFAKRCDLRCYKRLGLLLGQNVRKGTKGLTDLLEREATEAYAERKNRAREIGEKTGTKLLMPMFLMLVVVLVIIIVPAFVSIQI